MKELTKEKDYLIIDRSKWKTGSSGKGSTLLLNSKGYMCCLGFRCNQMGIPKKDLIDLDYPYQLVTQRQWEKIPDLIKKNKKGCAINSKFTQEAILINDGFNVTNKERENLLIKHFATKNIIVEFKGKYKNKL